MNLKFKLELELTLGCLEGVSKSLGGLMYFASYYMRGEAPPKSNSQNTKAPQSF